MSTQQPAATATPASTVEQPAGESQADRDDLACYHTVTIHTDGSYHCDTDAAGIGYVIEALGGEVLTERSETVEVSSSMKAEATAVLEGLQIAKEFEPTRVVIYSDCPPLIEKLSGEVAATNGVLEDIATERESIDRVDVFKVPRNLNKEADGLAHNAMLRDSDSEK